jgi:hypothetical protein
MRISRDLHPADSLSSPPTTVFILVYVCMYVCVYVCTCVHKEVGPCLVSRMPQLTQRLHTYYVT